jgi:pyrroline-5-carboxylate reductase
MKLGNKKITFLGAGNMAEALISGILSAKLLPAKNILASDIDAEKLKKLKKEKSIQIAASNQEAVEKSDIIFLAVKPQNLPELFDEIADALNLKKLVISIAAGVRIEKLEKMALKPLRVVRVMPNLPAVVQAAISALYRGKKASAQDMQLALMLLGAVGKVLTVKKESDLDVVTALSGSGPGYLFYFAEALEKAGVQQGLPLDVVAQLVKETLFGASKLLSQSNEPAEQLRYKVTSKGGTTEAAIKHLEEKNFIPTIEKAIAAAVKRSQELSR